MFIVVGLFSSFLCVEIKLLFYFITNVCVWASPSSPAEYFELQIYISISTCKKKKKETFLAPVGVLCTIANQK